MTKLICNKYNNIENFTSTLIDSLYFDESINTITGSIDELKNIMLDMMNKNCLI